MGQAEKRPNTSTFSLFKCYTSSVTRPRTVTQNKTLRFSKRVKWINILYGRIPQQVLRSTLTRHIFINGLGAVISSLRRVRGGRGLFTSDDITAVAV